MGAVRQHFVKYEDGETVVGPGTDLDGTCLLVEREKLDVDRTQADVDRRRLPDNETVRVDGDLRNQLYRKVAVSAVGIQYNTRSRDVRL